MAAIDPILWEPLWRVRVQYADRSLSPVEYVEACLDRIEALDARLHPFITRTPDLALESARLAQERYATGRPLGALDGIPIVLKDDLWTTGVRSTGGSLLFDDFVPDTEGLAASRIRRCGACVVGKTNMPEFALFSRARNRLVPEAVNPWDPTRTPGASSSGSASAVATGMVPVAVGSDGGGSIRIPSALCGIVGLFPTPGLVPDDGGFTIQPYSCWGPMGRDVRDVATLLDVMTGRDIGLNSVLGGVTARGARDTRHGGTGGAAKGLRVGWTPDLGHIDIEDPRVVAAARDAVGVLADHGATVVEIDSGFAETYLILSAVGFDGNEYRGGVLPFLSQPAVKQMMAKRPDLLTPYVRDRPSLSHAQIEAGAPAQAELRRKLLAVFDDVDVLCTPTMTVTAPVLSDDWTTPYARADRGTAYTALVNVTACTAASVPCGLVDGLPVGLQVIGRPFAESTVLAACQAFEEARGPFPHPQI